MLDAKLEASDPSFFSGVDSATHISGILNPASGSVTIITDAKCEASDPSYFLGEYYAHFGPNGPADFSCYYVSSKFLARYGPHTFQS